jgi:hypothetical protein
MIKFTAEPNLLINFSPPIGEIKRVQFDNKGEYFTDNQRIIDRFKHKYDSVPLKSMEEVKEVKVEVKPKATIKRKPRKRVTK